MKKSRFTEEQIAFALRQADHQANRLGRCAVIVAVGVHEHRIEVRSVNLVGQQDQFMAGIEKLVEMRSEEFKLVASLRFGRHMASMPGVTFVLLQHSIRCKHCKVLDRYP